MLATAARSQRRAAPLYICVGALLAVLSSTATPAVLVVHDTGQLGPFTDIAPAVAAAVDGDTILVIPGSYGPFVIDGKSLTVVADGPEVLTGAVAIRNLGVAQAVVVRGLTVYDSFNDVGPITVDQCGGAVVLENLTVKTTTGFPVSPDHGVAILGSNRVNLVRCIITAPKGASGTSTSPGVDGGAGIFVVDSRVGVYETVATGGEGGPGTSLFGVMTSTRGGDGLLVTNGVVTASGSVFVGGKGGFGSETAPGLCDLPSSDSGNGITLGNNGKTTLIDSTAIGGVAATSIGSCPPVGVAGVPIDPGVNGVVTTVSEPARKMKGDSPVREGESIVIAAAGAPNEPSFLLISPAIQGTLEPALTGHLLTGPPLTVVALGPLGNNGGLILIPTVPVGLLPPGIDAANIFLQAIAPGSTGNGVLGSGSAVTILRAGM